MIKQESHQVTTLTVGCLAGAQKDWRFHTINRIFPQHCLLMQTADSLLPEEARIRTWSHRKEGGGEKEAGREEKESLSFYFAKLSFILGLYLLLFSSRG